MANADTIDRQTYLFVVKHITKEPGAKLIYGVGLNGATYFFSKTLHIANCKQLDSHPPLEPTLFTELCAIITEIELAYLERPSLELINQDIGTILARVRSCRAFLRYTHYSINLTG